MLPDTLDFRSKRSARSLPGRLCYKDEFRENVLGLLYKLQERPYNRGDNQTPGWPLYYGLGQHDLPACCENGRNRPSACKMRETASRQDPPPPSA
jgi:hypothetical protein